MWNLFRKDPISLVVSIKPDKPYYEAPCDVGGTIEISNNADLVVNLISVRIAAYEVCYYCFCFCY
jgi:hypothetical protein